LRDGLFHECFSCANIFLVKGRSGYKTKSSTNTQVTHTIIKSSDNTNK
jgi:hypothetical protein